MQNGNNKSRQTFPLQTQSRLLLLLLSATHSITHSFRERNEQKTLFGRGVTEQPSATLPEAEEWMGGTADTHNGPFHSPLRRVLNGGSSLLPPTLLPLFAPLPLLPSSLPRKCPAANSKRIRE